MPVLDGAECPNVALTVADDADDVLTNPARYPTMVLRSCGIELAADLTPVQVKKSEGFEAAKEEFFKIVCDTIKPPLVEPYACPINLANMGRVFQACTCLPTDPGFVICNFISQPLYKDLQPIADKPACEGGAAALGTAACAGEFCAGVVKDFDAYPQYCEAASSFVSPGGPATCRANVACRPTETCWTFNPKPPAKVLNKARAM